MPSTFQSGGYRITTWIEDATPPRIDKPAEEEEEPQTNTTVPDNGVNETLGNSTIDQNETSNENQTLNDTQD